MEVVVQRSAKRRKTIEAELVGDVLEVRVPASMSRAEEQHWVEKMRARFERRHRTDAVDIEARARRLAKQYGFPTPASVRWVDNQRRRWGSCTPEDGSIRISSRLAAWPRWVLDFVLVHELAHLIEIGHNARFDELVARYPLAERATGFLIAKGLDPEDSETNETEPDVEEPFVEPVQLSLTLG
jgi:predicted metal-dependent hydrolase